MDSHTNRFAPSLSVAGRWLLILAGCLLVGVLYVASIGPAYWVIVNSEYPHNKWPAFKAVYAPIWWVGKQWPAFDLTMSEYCNWGISFAPVPVAPVSPRIQDRVPATSPPMVPY